METPSQRIGFTCAYAPLPVIDAAGYTPCRILPVGDAPDQAGSLLHDNLCPHVKRILDQALAKDLPELTGMVFVNSCDAMRRLADAWPLVRPNDLMVRLDLPTTADEPAIRFWAGEIRALATALSIQSGRPVETQAIQKSMDAYDRLFDNLEQVKQLYRSTYVPVGNTEIQELYNRVSTEPVDTMLEETERILSKPADTSGGSGAVPVYLFGNVLPDPEAMALFEACGAYIMDDDLCTGSRIFSPKPPDVRDTGDLFYDLARRSLLRPPCSRTLDTTQPGGLARRILERARACNARGVIGHTVKFCDPYLDRMPGVRDVLRDAGLPMLILEGDCTLGSIGQQRTRIEAFIEMLR